MGISGPGVSQAHRVLEVLRSTQDGDVVSSLRTLLLHLGVQWLLCYLPLYGGDWCQGMAIAAHDMVSSGSYATPRSNAGHAQKGTFFGSRAPIFRAKFKGKHRKQPESRMRDHVIA